MAIFESLLIGLMATGPVTRVPGTVQGYSELRNGDDQVDGALVMPTLRPQELLQFQLEAFLAPMEDFQAGPKTVRVPGNLHFPKQSETWGFIPLTLAKPEFGFYTTPGRSEELVTLSFRAPFGRLVDMGTNKAPFTEFIPLLKLRQYNFAGDREWAADRSIKSTLTGTFQKTANFVWKRSATDGMDIAVNFQKTPSNRWMPTDIVGRPAENGQLATAGAPMIAETKSLFMRILNGPDKKPVSGAGYFVSGTANSSHAINGVPESLQNVRLDGTQINWQPVNASGWMAVVREKTQLTSARKINGTVTAPAEFRTQILESWVNGASGAYNLVSPLQKGETLLLIFVGTSREVPAPALNDAEPLLFTYASDIRFYRL